MSSVFAAFIILTRINVFQVCRLQEQLEATVEKLEESKQLLKNNEKCKYFLMVFGAVHGWDQTWVLVHAEHVFLAVFLVQ